MSLQQAHAFIRYLRAHHREIPLPEERTIEWALQAGRQAGFTFTESELREAHRQDWLLRRLAGGLRGSQEGAGEPV